MPSKLRKPASTQQQQSLISSPLATGGAGFNFEQHVNAYWLSLLLVRGTPPILLDCSVSEVSFQTEGLGWHTDDFLVVGVNGAGTRRKLVGQVKRSVTVSATDDEFKKALLDYWQDFTTGSHFDPKTDCFVLVTLRGTNTLLEHFTGLLDCARAANDEADFERRLTTPGVLNKRSVSYCEAIKKIIEESNTDAITNALLWPFLKTLHVLPLDLASSTGQAEAAMKTLLAHTCSETDVIATASSSWNDLLRVAGGGMSHARTYGRVDLPADLRDKHFPCGVAEERILKALLDHSRLILNGIHSTIGNQRIHVARDGVMNRVLVQLATTQVVIVSGTAGSGKSSIVKTALAGIPHDYFVFSFRAEEFAAASLDQALHLMGISTNAAGVEAVLAGQHHKVLLIESAERLLEASTRDAFKDLLTLVRSDATWNLVLTCRDYSAELVKSSFLDATGIAHSTVEVPPLEDAELDQVEAAAPSLARPLSSPPLRRLLRNPYILGQALQMQWREDLPLPASEREFRARFWRDIVRADARAADGMPRRREQVFVQVALRRAQRLMRYVPLADLDANAADGLIRDSLIASSEKSRSLVAPAHDVLEDWAILAWFDEQHLAVDGSASEMAEVVGPYPALRRTYRKWISELIERDAASADALFRAALTESALPAYFQDDTLVALLRSTGAVAFLERHRKALFADGKRVLRRVMHLLRVACVTTAPWCDSKPAHGSVLNVPEGPAWACVLRIAQSHLEQFDQSDALLLLGLIEDWAKAVWWQCPYPGGHESAFAIASWLLPHFDDYQSNEHRKRALRVIAKIPKADAQAFGTLLRGDESNDASEDIAEDLREIIIDGLEGMSAARDLPDEVIAMIDKLIRLTDADLEQSDDLGWVGQTEPLFGIRATQGLDSPQPSAMRGPFLTLLRYHPGKALAFVVSLFNHGAQWYAQRRVRVDYVEGPFEISLEFADGTTRKQWCNSRLWNLYRGTSVGPYVLQSILMAFEHWLLEGSAKGLDRLLMHVLKESESAALTGVVASVATAFPQDCAETLLVLLGSPECILLDRGRLASEGQAVALNGLFTGLRSEEQPYEDERRQASARPHRRRDLEFAILDLQLGPLAERVHRVIDRHLAELPPLPEQDEGYQIWRLALNRMDLRRRSMGTRELIDGKEVIQLDLNLPDQDLKDMVEQTHEDHEALNLRLTISLWGSKTFRHEDDATYKPSEWKERLQEARSLEELDANVFDPDPGRGGPGYVAAVCIRDHWDELTDDEKSWCVDSVCTAISRESDHWSHLARIQRYEDAANRPSAWVVSLLVSKSLLEAEQARVREAFVVALTHPVDEVRSYAAFGVGDNLWKTDRELALRCAKAFAFEAMVIQDAVDQEKARLFAAGNFAEYHEGNWHERIRKSVAMEVRQRLFEPNAIPDDTLESLDLTRWYGIEGCRFVLPILSKAPSEQSAVAMFTRLGQAIVSWWDARRNHDTDDEEPEHRNYETEGYLEDFLERFLLRVEPDDAALMVAPIVEASDRHPSEVSSVLRGVIASEDQQPATSSFWKLWSQFADAIRKVRWLKSGDDEYCYGSELIRAIFLAIRWKETVRHWRSLESHVDLIHELFDDLLPCALVLEDYLTFLYQIGERELPQSFVRIEARLQKGEPTRMLGRSNTVYMLEVLLQRHVYSKPLELKQQPELRKAVLSLLDILVEHGSSAAFRMRDDFVTPATEPCTS